MTSLTAAVTSATAKAGAQEAAKASLAAPAPGGKAKGASRVFRLPGMSFSPTAETYLALGVVAIVSLLIVPLPPISLDFFLALSLGLSMVVLLVVLSVRSPLDFSVFPSFLLLITLLRLGLNVSSTRLILSTGHAGQVINAFGHFVIAGNVVVGLVIFLILVVINFVVITKGASRIAEVAARFTLDAMPGRQMSIDADLGAGMIDEEEARRRREEINHFADFYGSMDGAAKFVRGDAIAGLIITGINLVGGFIIGMTQRGMSAQGALSTYSSLTVGDGLVTQIPALIVSTAAGILVTYGSRGAAVAPSLREQLTRSPRALWTVAGILGLFAAVPGLPPVPFILLGGALGFVAYRVRNRKRQVAGEEVPDAADAEKTGDMPEVQELLAVEPLELEVGYGLIPLVDESRQADLLQRIGILRKQLAVELGIVIPPVRVRDNIQLPANEYAIKVRGVRADGGTLVPHSLLALDTSGSCDPVEGIPTTDPSFGIRAVWISPESRVEAETLGYTVVDPPTVLTTHLMETIRQYAAELLSRQDTRKLVDGLKETNPSLVEDVIPSKVPLGTLHRVLQRLVKEGIPIRDLATILETLSDEAEQTKDPEILTEHVRRALSLVIAQMLVGPDGMIEAITVGPRLELALMKTFSPTTQESGQRGLEPRDLTAVLDALGHILSEMHKDGSLPPLITPPALRVGVRRLVEPSFPRLPVVSLAELPPQTPIQTLRVWELPNET